MLPSNDEKGRVESGVRPRASAEHAGEAGRREGERSRSQADDGVRLRDPIAGAHRREKIGVERRAATFEGCRGEAHCGGERNRAHAIDRSPHARERARDEAPSVTFGWTARSSDPTGSLARSAVEGWASPTKPS